MLGADSSQRWLLACVNKAVIVRESCRLLNGAGAWRSEGCAGVRRLVPLSHGDHQHESAVASALTAATLVGVVAGSTAFGGQLPMGNPQAQVDALRPAGVFGLSGGGDDRFPPDTSERVNHRLRELAWA